MLTIKFEELRMEEDEQFIDFYTKLQDLVNYKAGLRDPLKSEAIVRKILRLLPKRFRSKVTAIEESKDIDKLVVEELIGTLQTFDMTLRLSAKKKGIALKVNKLTSPKENSDDEVAFITKGCRKFYKKNTKTFRRKFSSKVTKDSSRRKEVPIEEVICYECKGQGHYASNYANKKYKLKSKYKKAMAATWNNDTDNSKEELSSNEEESSQGVVAFVAFTNDSNNESSSESKDVKMKVNFKRLLTSSLKKAPL